MTEIERIVRANRANLDLLNQLRDAVGVELAGSPFERIDPPAATAEGAVLALLDDARLWSRSPRLVSIVTELETLASSFAPNGRVRRLRQLSPEAVAALLDEAPGGPTLAHRVTLADGGVIDVGELEETVALLTARPPEDARLLGRLRSDGAPADPIAGVAITFLPVADRFRLRAVFAAPDAPGRGDLAALKRDLDEADRARVADGATRAVVNLKIAFRIGDKQRDHRRGTTAATYLSPAPLASLALTVVDLVLPREAPNLFLGDQVEAGRHDESRARHADRVRYVFTEILDTARAIAEQTVALQGLDLFCGFSVTRRVSDLIAQERALREEEEIGENDGDEEVFDRPTAAARRLIESVMQARDTVLLLSAYEATFLAYIDMMLNDDPCAESRTACDVIVRMVCGGLLRRYRLARADLDDGVSYWTDVKLRATGSAQPLRWLPPSVVAAPVVLSRSLVVPPLAEPTHLSVLDDIVEDIAAEIDGSIKRTGGPYPAIDPSPRQSSQGYTLRGAWIKLKAAYPLSDFSQKK